MPGHPATLFVVCADFLVNFQTIAQQTREEAGCQAKSLFFGIGAAHHLVVAFDQFIEDSVDELIALEFVSLPERLVCRLQQMLFKGCAVGRSEAIGRNIDKDPASAVFVVDGAKTTSAFFHSRHG